MPEIFHVCVPVFLFFLHNKDTQEDEKNGEKTKNELCLVKLFKEVMIW